MAQVTYGGYPSARAAMHPQSGQGSPHGGYEQQEYPAQHPAYAPHPGPYAQTEYAGYPQSGAAGYPQAAAAGYPPRAAIADAAAPGMTRLVNLAGAVVSVALLLGVGIWSYRLTVRDVTGVPVIQALEGPIRSSPDDPGGHQAPYQELSVNSVAAQGEAPGTAQIIAVAPPPVELSDEDRAIAELNGARQEAITAPAPGTVTAPITAPTSPATLTPTPQPVAPTPVERVAAAPVALVPASAPGVARSPVPPRRPGAVTRVAAAAPVATNPAVRTIPGGVDPQAEAVLQDLVTRLSPATVMEVDPSSLAPGTRLVQLNVYESEDQARAAWDALAARFPAYLDGRGRVVDAATAGGRTFYRLRAHGFVDEPEARRFCSVFIAEGVDCIPVLTGR